MLRYFKLFLGNKKANKGKTQVQVKEEERKYIMQIIEEKVDIRGGYQKPVYTDLFAYRIILLPMTFYLWIKFHVRWYYKFTLNKEPYGDEEKMILIRKNLKPESNAQW